MHRTWRQGGALSSIVLACAMIVSVHEIHAQSGLPTGWQARDIGGPAIAGSTNVSSGTWTIAAGGTNIWDGADQFQFAYMPVTGDADISVRLASFTIANDWSKAGVMIRESLNADARNAYMMYSRGSGPGFQQRTATAGATTRTTGAGGFPGWFRLVRQGNTFTGYTSSTGTSWTTVASGTISMAATVYVGLAVNSRDANASATATFTNVAVATSGSGVTALPSPWINADVGSPSLAGSATSPSAGSFNVTGAGTDIWGTADQFQFVYQAVQGDTQIVARLASLQATDPWSKAGVMIRQSLTAGSPHASVVGTAANGWNFMWRSSAGAISFSTHGPSGAAPGWMKLTRVGNVLTAYLSSDGATWTPLDSEPITMSGTIYVGLAVTSHNAGARATDSFTNVAVTTPSGNQPPSVSITSPTSGATFTAPADITINATAADSDGTVAQVDFYRGSTLIGSDTTSPYSVTWSSAPAGSYQITAVAKDNGGTTTTSAAVNVSVNAAGNQLPTVSITSPTSGATFTAPANIAITATASDSDGTIAGVDFYQGSTLISTDTTSPYSATWNSAPAGTYTLTAVARDNAGGSRTSTAVNVTVSGTASGLPSPWVNGDVGSPSLAGSTTSPSSGSFTVTGGGTDIWGAADQFQFAYQAVQGDTQIVARVASVQATDPWSKAGVMIRQSLTAGSPHAAVVGTPANGWNFLWRSTAGATSFSTHGPTGTAPGWVKLTRVGNTITSYLSADGNTWTVLDSEPITMSGTIYVGLAVTSHNSGARATDSFTNVAVSAVTGTNQPPTVSITSPASGATYTAPASMTISASASDSDGTVAAVDFYNGSQLIATDTTSPYSASWTNVGAGTYTLTAIARDNAGASRTSTAVNVTVNGTSQPTTLIFTASSNHATAVTSYVVAIYRAADDPATASPVATRDIGKPTPAANGDISVDISIMVDPLPSGSYKVVVRALGTGGTAPSVPSPNFTK